MRLIFAFVGSIGISSIASYADPTFIYLKPSFDCALASNTTELTICGDSEVSLRDRYLAILYAGLKDMNGEEKLDVSQSAWIHQRNACKTDRDCLNKSYADRIAILAYESGDNDRLTGVYKYDLGSKDIYGEPTDFGEAFIVRMADGTLSGTINTVSSPANHICEIEFAHVEQIGESWFWQDFPPDRWKQADVTTILFHFAKRSLRVDSTNGSKWCGRRGFFDETYLRAQ